MSRNVNGDIEKGQATGLSDLAVDASAFFEAANLLEHCRIGQFRLAPPRESGQLSSLGMPNRN
jgi:hypothetical protein